MHFSALARCTLVVLVGCGNHVAPPPPKHDAGAVARADAAPAELPARPLGMSDLAGFEWRKRAGQPAFRSARKAEGREDWPAVAGACKQALAADPGHLEAAWLYAVALAKLAGTPTGTPTGTTGALDAVTEPLAIAGAGDFGKWAIASLDQPALQPYLATPAGAAWRHRVEQDRARYTAALARSIVVIAAGDLYGVDLDPDTRPGVLDAPHHEDPPRWYRLTRTYGGVIGAFASPDRRRIAYVSRLRAASTRPAPKLSIGVVDLATGHTSHALELSAPATIAFATGKPGGFWIGEGAATRMLDDDGTATPTKQKRASGTWLEVAATGRVHIHRLPVAGVIADWDDQSLASAIKLPASNRVVTVPSSGQIDGNTIVWSPDRDRIAFVASISDQCKPGTPNNAAFVADSSTGTVTELERATGGIAIEWLGFGRLAIAGDDGVRIAKLAGEAVKIEGANGLVSPRRKPRCLPDLADEPMPDEDPEPGDPGTP